MLRQKIPSAVLWSADLSYTFMYATMLCRFLAQYHFHLKLDFAQKFKNFGMKLLGFSHSVKGIINGK